MQHRHGRKTSREKKKRKVFSDRGRLLTSRKTQVLHYEPDLLSFPLQSPRTWEQGKSGIKKCRFPSKVTKNMLIFFAQSTHSYLQVPL